MNPLECYLKELRDIRATGAAVAETSFYSALSNLFNEIGKGLKRFCEYAGKHCGRRN
jgi:hypothetical protein